MRRAGNMALTNLNLPASRNAAYLRSYRRANVVSGRCGQSDKGAHHVAYTFDPLILRASVTYGRSCHPQRPPASCRDGFDSSPQVTGFPIALGGT
jgi:hypothetical protein